MRWSVYIILCSDQSLYAGISTDVGRRFEEHASLKGAKDFRSCQPLEVVFREDVHSRSSASRREAEIKKMKRSEKLLMVSEYSGGGCAEKKAGENKSI